ncbi:ABC transporter permease [Lichenihabitans psoromatis]|uniref:ABC transporter permease n=1 Tax=Lichenihabitans psoromatis TaxID=2528642 RepID=UPI001035B157|nr:ABC transporter permease subunit [Lichenihabitans psoromatis]
MGADQPVLAKGAGLTVLIAIIGVLFGLPIGLLAALARLSQHRLLRRVFDAYALVFRGTPMLVQIFILYYGLGEFSAVRHIPSLWWLIGDALHCSILAVVLNTIAYTSEIFRSAFMALPRGMTEAAQACGMSSWTTLIRIRFPLALRQALPAYGNEVAIIVKESSLASTITVLEITGYAKRMMSETFAVMEVFVMASVFYLAINFAALGIVRVVERRLRGQKSFLDVRWRWKRVPWNAPSGA